MGKISEYLIELAEMITDWVEEYGFTVTQIHDRLKNELTEDEYRFFQAHDDIIFDMVADTTGPLTEARGIKGDVLRPWRGRKVRDNMGYGKGNRANYNPEKELDDEEEYVGQSEDDWIYDTPETHKQRMKARKEMFGQMGVEDKVFDKEGKRIDWPEEMDDEMLSGHDHEGDPDMDYDLDYTNDPDEDIYPTNEDWTFIQTAALTVLIPLLGTLAINYYKSKDPSGEKAEELKAGWKDWLEDKRRQLFPGYDRKMRRKERQEKQEKIKATRANVKKAIEEFGEGKLTLDDIEKLVVEDEAIANAVKSLMQDPKLGYQRLYGALKQALEVSGVRGTPIPDIKDRFVGKAKEYQKNRKALRDEVKVMLKAFSEDRATYEDVAEVLNKIPEGKQLLGYLDQFMQGKFYDRLDFYDVLKRLFRVGTANETPGPKLIKTLKKKHDAGELVKESLLMPSINEYFDEDEEDKWVTINGKRVHKDSREYMKWYEEEGEFDDTEGREYRRNKYGW